MVQSRHPRSPRGFTLVELLVSMVVLVIVLVLLTQLTGTLRGVISRTSASIGEFQGAREAFETMSRRVAQATLNSYDDLNPTLAGTSATAKAGSYVRASELRFISGDAATLLTGTYSAGVLGSGQAYPNSPYPTDAIFFQAPLGFSLPASSATAGATPPPYSLSLAQMLNTCGYFIKWGSDELLRPSFLPTTTIPPRYRFRLMELIEPTEKLRIYSNGSIGTSGPSSTVQTRSASWDYASTDWFQYPIGKPGSASPESPSPVHVLAENIIFLALVPMVAPQNATHPLHGAPDGTSTDILSDDPYAKTNTGYLYDTTPDLTNNPPRYSQNQLPPLVYLLMIAVDEKSFARYQASAGTGAPTNLGLQNILADPTYKTRQDDVAAVVKALTDNKIDYRIFSIAIPLGAH